MRYVGVIGYPVGHSLSPVFQQAALDRLGLDIHYELWETPPQGLAETVDGLRVPDHLGANVTIPHKEAIIPFLDELDELARRVGAVNTIVNRQGRLHGHNTDVGGFLRALRQDGGFDPAGAHVLVVGAGGAARAVVVALTEVAAASVAVTDIIPSRATRLVEDLRPVAGGTQLIDLPAAHISWEDAAGGCQLLVNCTPVGLAGTPQEKESPVPIEAIPAGALVFDLVYRPQETVLMAAARRRGARVLGGLPMLIYQGAASFQMWTGHEAPVDVMFSAARQYLNQAGAEGGR